MNQKDIDQLNFFILAELMSKELSECLAELEAVYCRDAIADSVVAALYEITSQRPSELLEILTKEEVSLEELKDFYLISKKQDSRFVIFRAKYTLKPRSITDETNSSETIDDVFKRDIPSFSNYLARVYSDYCKIISKMYLALPEIFSILILQKISTVRIAIEDYIIDSETNINFGGFFADINTRLSDGVALNNIILLLIREYGRLEFAKSLISSSCNIALAEEKKGNISELCASLNVNVVEFWDQSNDISSVIHEGVCKEDTDFWMNGGCDADIAKTPEYILKRVRAQNLYESNIANSKQYIVPNLLTRVNTIRFYRPSSSFSVIPLYEDIDCIALTCQNFYHRYGDRIKKMYLNLSSGAEGHVVGLKVIEDVLGKFSSLQLHDANSGTYEFNSWDKFRLWFPGYFMSMKYDFNKFTIEASSEDFLKGYNSANIFVQPYDIGRLYFLVYENVDRIYLPHSNHDYYRFLSSINLERELDYQMAIYMMLMVYLSSGSEDDYSHECLIYARGIISNLALTNKLNVLLYFHILCETISLHYSLEEYDNVVSCLKIISEQRKYAKIAPELDGFFTAVSNAYLLLSSGYYEDDIAAEIENISMAMTDANVELQILMRNEIVDIVNSFIFMFSNISSRYNRSRIDMLSREYNLAQSYNYYLLLLSAYGREKCILEDDRASTRQGGEQALEVNAAAITKHCYTLALK